MGVATHQTVEDSAQADGRRYVRYRYDFTEGDIIFRGPKLVETLFDDDADRLALVPTVEADVKIEEQYYAEARAIAGDDFSAINSDLVHNTTSEAAGFILKRMSNRFQEVTKFAVYNELPELFLLRKIWTELTDAQIANFMGELEVDVASWRTSFTTMKDGVTNYTSPFAIYTDVPPI